jgi:hypothetical protein
MARLATLLVMLALLSAAAPPVQAARPFGELLLLMRSV